MLFQLLTNLNSAAHDLLIIVVRPKNIHPSRSHDANERNFENEGSKRATRIYGMRRIRQIMIRRNEGGFSLIEVLISLTILSVGLLAVAGMQITSIKGNFSSGNVTNATVLAQSKLEDLKNLSYTDSNLTSGQHSEGAISGSVFSMSYDVVDLTSTMKAITVIVQWKDIGDHSISLSTIRAK